MAGQQAKIWLSLIDTFYLAIGQSITFTLGGEIWLWSVCYDSKQAGLAISIYI
jgi:hypothetical protein